MNHKQMILGMRIKFVRLVLIAVRSLVTCVARTCCTCKFTDIMAVVVQADPLDKRGEKESRRYGAKECWYVEKVLYCVVW